MKTLILTLFLAACNGTPTDSDTDTGADTDSSADTDTGADTDADTLDPNLYASVCDAAEMDGGTQTSNAPCSAVSQLDAGTRTVVRADCTDSNITAHLDKAHVAFTPTTPTRDTLWVHLPGTGGAPTNAENVGVAALQEGYHFIGLAYPNDRNTGARCSCPEGPRPAACKELVRYELVTGDDVTPWFDMEPDEAIIPRLEALLAWLQTEEPAGGWDSFTDANGSVIWDHVAVSGFSQGGAMAGMIGREFELDRELHFSNIVGSSYSVLHDPASAIPCTDDDECSDVGVCCYVDQAPCDTIPDDAICIEPDAEPWIYTGADTDGDGLGDGDASNRATPTDRIFAVIHRRETAWSFMPIVTEEMGLGGTEAWVDTDTDRGPYAPTARFFSTDLEPNGASCSYHQAIGPDACQPRDGQNRPALLPAWRHAMRADL